MEKEIRKIFKGLDLDEDVFNEDVMKQFALLIESKVGEFKRVVSEELQLEYEARYEVDKENLVDQLDEYLNYFAESFIEDNKENITDSIKVKTAEKILEKMDHFVNEFNVSLSEEGLDQDEEIEELKSELNEAVNQNIELKNVLVETHKAQLIEDTSYTIDVDSKREAFVQLAENFEYDDSDTFQEKLDFLSEKINTSKEEGSNTLEEKEVSENQEQTLEESNNGGHAPMKDYMKFITRK